MTRVWPPESGPYPPTEAPAQRTMLPRLPRVYLPRPRLWEQLDASSQGAVTILVAPAGAGKTLGLSGWVHRGLETDPEQPMPIWVSDAQRFGPDDLEDVLSAAAATSDDEAPSRPRLVVVDDAHTLPAATVRCLDLRLRETPESIRVVLATRWDLALTRLMPELLGHLSVIRGSSLSLDDDETAVLVAHHGRTTDPQVVEAVSARSQGWCAAVVLAARAISAAPDPLVAARAYASGDLAIGDRVASEVFAALQPRQRHLLLCVAGEEVVTPDVAVHLTHDTGAGDVLFELENNGLLVTRLPATSSTDVSVTGGRYRIHPLLIEVIRRRLRVGGVDVARARSTVERAVRLDLARGDTAGTFGRLLALNMSERAARLLAEHGPGLLMRGQASLVSDFVRDHPDAVESVPEAWVTLVLEAWMVSDLNGVRHWSERYLGWRDREGGDRFSAEVAVLRVLRARMGEEPLGSALDHARKVLARHDRSSSPLLALLMTEVAVACNWRGDLTEAEQGFSSAALRCRAQGLPVLEAVCLSYLAFTEFMAGREQACVRVAEEALAILRVSGWTPGFAQARAEVANELARLSDTTAVGDISIDPARAAVTGVRRVHDGDSVCQFWSLVLRARHALARGDVAGAEQALDSVAITWPVLPHHLGVALRVERGFLAALAVDQQQLAALTSELEGTGARGEAALVAALLADCRGERRAAADLFTAAAECATLPQPPTRALALVAAAQLLHAAGDGARALRQLREAATVTGVRRNSVPFLGWTRLGTPIAALLNDLLESFETPWAAELARGAAGHADITAVLAPATATRRERAVAPEAVVLPSLSPREREVLNELARGSTYADIAASLLVSENTVKTHVSSLYAKLAASRRSEALAAARKLQLI